MQLKKYCNLIGAATIVAARTTSVYGCDQTLFTASAAKKLRARKRVGYARLGLAYPVSCAGLGHLLMAKHCPLSLNVCFTPPTAPHPSPPPPIDSIRVITEVEKNQGHTNS